MVRCVNCLVAIPATQPYQYNAIYLGPEIVSVLEEWIERQVNEKDLLCQECVNLLIVEASNRTEGNVGKRQYGHQSACISCGVSITRRRAKRARYINKGDHVWSCVADAIGPLEIPSNARVCWPCWLRAHRLRPTVRPETPLIASLSTATNDVEDSQESAMIFSDASPADGRDSNNYRKPSLRLRNSNIVKTRNKNTLESGISDDKTDIDMGTENNNLDINELDDKDDTSEYIEDSTVPKVKKRRIKAKKKKTKTKRTNKRQPVTIINERLFDITELSLGEQVAEIEKRKNSLNYKKSLYRCTTCFKGYLDEGAYDYHMLKHTNVFGEYRCRVCKIYYKRKSSLQNHVIFHSRRFSCKKCAFVTAQRHNAKLHEDWHNGAKYYCPHCTDKFVKISSCLHHIRVKHPTDIVCQLCGFSFLSERGINHHLKLKHVLDNVPIPSDGPHCELCDIRFINSDALKRHISVSAKHHSGKEGAMPNARRYRKRTKLNIERAIERFGNEADDKHPSLSCKQNSNLKKKLHTEGKQYKCESCDKSFPMKCRLQEHMRLLHGDIWLPTEAKQYECELCDKSFPMKCRLQEHMRLLHSDVKTTYPCAVCGKHLSSESSRWKHMACTHATERRYQCDSCDKSFFLRFRLREHFQRMHCDNPRIYTCHVCGKQYGSDRNCRRHMVVHSGLKPYKCEMCGKTFKRNSERKSHISYIHLKKPLQKKSNLGKRGDKQVGSQEGSSPKTTVPKLGVSSTPVPMPLETPQCPQVL